MLVNARLAVLESILLHLESWGGKGSSPRVAADVPLQGPSVTVPGKTQLGIFSDFLALRLNFRHRPWLKPLWEWHMACGQLFVGLWWESFCCVFT